MPRVDVIGLGYVGLPLSVEITEAGMVAVGYDVSQPVVDCINAGRSHVGDVPKERLTEAVERAAFRATTDAADPTAFDLIPISVPTPFNKNEDPHLSSILSGDMSVPDVLRKGQTVVLENTTSGTTDEVLLPLLEESGWIIGEDVHPCSSLECLDPRNEAGRVKNTFKAIGCVKPACLGDGAAAFRRVFDTWCGMRGPEEDGRVVGSSGDGVSWRPSLRASPFRAP